MEPNIYLGDPCYLQPIHTLKGYLAHKKTLPPPQDLHRALEAQACSMVLGMGVFL